MGGLDSGALLADPSFLGHSWTSYRIVALYSRI